MLDRKIVGFFILQIHSFFGKNRIQITAAAIKQQSWMYYTMFNIWPRWCYIICYGNSMQHTQRNKHNKVVHFPFALQFCACGIYYIRNEYMHITQINLYVTTIIIQQVVIFKKHMHTHTHERAHECNKCIWCSHYHQQQQHRVQRRASVDLL